RQLDTKYILLSATFIKNTAKDINGILKFVYKWRIIYVEYRISRFAEAFINTNLDAIKQSNLLFTIEDNENKTRFYSPNNVLLADEVYKIRHGRISGFTKICRSNKQYLANFVRIDYANAIIHKANKPRDRIRGAKEVEGVVEVKKLEAATF
ncbi:hypothetical protein Tdes44962_MAKER10421, partial [Teratosphaeria destructans]